MDLASIMFLSIMGASAGGWCYTLNHQIKLVPQNDGRGRKAREGVWHAVVTLSICSYLFSFGFLFILDFPKRLLMSASSGNELGKVFMLGIFLFIPLLNWWVLKLSIWIRNPRFKLKFR